MPNVPEGPGHFRNWSPFSASHTEVAFEHTELINNYSLPIALVNGQATFNKSLRNRLLLVDMDRTAGLCRLIVTYLVLINYGRCGMGLEWVCIAMWFLGPQSPPKSWRQCYCNNTYIQDYIG